MLILFQGNTYLYQRMPDKVTEYFLFLNTPGVISGLFLCRLLAREGLTFPNIYYLFRILEEKGHKSRPNFFIISRTVCHYFSRVGRQEKCRFQESIIFNNRASYISKRKMVRLRLYGCMDQRTEIRTRNINEKFNRNDFWLLL